jgi:hypothetical protein
VCMLRFMECSTTRVETRRSKLGPVGPRVSAGGVVRLRR